MNVTLQLHSDKTEVMIIGQVDTAINHISKSIGSLSQSITQAKQCRSLGVKFLSRLQLIQNFAARILTHARKYDHITHFLASLYWLDVAFGIYLLTFKALRGLTQSYVSDLLLPDDPSLSFYTYTKNELYCRTWRLLLSMLSKINVSKQVANKKIIIIKIILFCCFKGFEPFYLKHFKHSKPWQSRT